MRAVVRAALHRKRRPLRAARLYRIAATAFSRCLSRYHVDFIRSGKAAAGAAGARQEDRMRKRIDGRAMQAFMALIVTAASVVPLSGCTSFLKPQEKHAVAQLLPTLGSQTRGTVTFIERSDGVQVTYNFVGLPPNTDHALQVHERGDCNAADGSSAGAVFSPAAERLKTGARVEGDLGNIRADAGGVAAGFIVAPDVSLDGVRSVLQRSVLLHRDATDPYAYPQHGPGPAVACGLIRSQ
jgi:Cu-Zn family superoxide dismutase